MDKADEWSCYIGTLCTAESPTERERLPVADVPNAIMYFIELEVNRQSRVETSIQHSMSALAIMRESRNSPPHMGIYHCLSISNFVFHLR
jgi:hypothetical protein